ncbi:YoaK family protein [Pseudochelatococcus sp. B33]
MSRRQSPAAETDRGAPSKIAFALLLTVVAGFIDAVGYMELGHFYLSFMSGNSTHLGMAVAQADRPEAMTAAALIAAFVAGVAAGTLIVDRAESEPGVLVLSTELFLVIVAILLLYAGRPVVALCLVAGAMGMQNALRQFVDGADLGKGFVTGNLFSLGQSLARLGRGRRPKLDAALNGLSWGGFFVGVVAGSFTYQAIGIAGSLAAIAVLLAFLIIAVRAGWPNHHRWKWEGQGPSRELTDVDDRASGAAGR